MTNNVRQGTPYCPYAGSYQPMKEVLAMASVPWQHFHSVYEPDQALYVGTIFPELNLPFRGQKGGCQ